MQPTTETNLTLDQLNAMIKTLGIAITNLYGKTRNTNPSSPQGQMANEELVMTLSSLITFATAMLTLLKGGE